MKGLKAKEERNIITQVRVCVLRFCGHSIFIFLMSNFFFLQKANHAGEMPLHAAAVSYPHL